MSRLTRDQRCHKCQRLSCRVSHAPCALCGMSSNFFPFPSVPPPDVAVSSNRSGPLYAGTGLSITCTATLDSSVNSDENLSISWSGQERIPSTIYSISSTTNHPVGGYISVLTISPLAVQDNGTFTCTVTVTGLDLSQSAISTNSTNVNVTGEHTRDLVSDLANYFAHFRPPSSSGGCEFL